MTAVIESTPFGTRPYRLPKLEDKFCPIIGGVCAGEACAFWRGSQFGCALAEARE